MKRLPRNSIAAATARWGAWLLVCLLLWQKQTYASPVESTWLLVLFGYVTIYSVVWTRHLPQIVSRTNDGSIVIVYDLVLSALPIWPTGGWYSPFLPFALSVLVVPAISRGWRGGSFVAAVFLAVDQLILWTTPTNPLEIAFNDQDFALFGHEIRIDGSFALLGRTLLPFVLVAVVAGVVEGRKRYFRQGKKRTLRPAAKLQLERPSPSGILDVTNEERVPSFSPARGANSERVGLWGKERSSQPMVERRSSTSIQAALRHVRVELEVAGIRLSTQIDGDEARIPPQIRVLLTKAIDIAVDNVINHAHAHNVALQIKICKDYALLSICDDGIGLYDGTAEPPGFHQLKRLRFRVQELGGALHVEERGEGGVRFELRVPFVA